MSVWRTVSVLLEFSPGCDHGGSVKEDRWYSCEGQGPRQVKGELGFYVNDAGGNNYFSRVECFVEIEKVPKMLPGPQQFRLEVGQNQFYVPIDSAISAFVLDLAQPAVYGDRIDFGLTNDGDLWKTAGVRLHFIN